MQYGQRNLTRHGNNEACGYRLESYNNMPPDLPEKAKDNGENTLKCEIGLGSFALVRADSMTNLIAPIPHLPCFLNCFWKVALQPANHSPGSQYECAGCRKLCLLYDNSLWRP